MTSHIAMWSACYFSHREKLFWGTFCLGNWCEMVCTSSGMCARVEEGNKKLIKQLLNVMKNMCAQMAGRTNYHQKLSKQMSFPCSFRAIYIFRCWVKRVKLNTWNTQMRSNLHFHYFFFCQSFSHRLHILTQISRAAMKVFQHSSMDSPPLKSINTSSVPWLR